MRSGNLHSVQDQLAARQARPSVPKLQKQAPAKKPTLEITSEKCGQSRRKYFRIGPIEGLGVVSSCGSLIHYQRFRFQYVLMPGWASFVFAVTRRNHATHEGRLRPLIETRNCIELLDFMPCGGAPKRGLHARSIRRSIPLSGGRPFRAGNSPWELRNHRLDEFCARISRFIFRSGELSASLVALATNCANIVAKATIIRPSQHLSKMTLFPTASHHGIPYP